ncbi:histidinol-phosphate transaminase [Carboxydothermus ferrireducens]|uniref:Histidinol-phosphate aminotransferase n=1 Tax=Carboxydothermus ferrireducens DSM 11255 TaxID=1119529 RepID=A0ABX2RAV6_9THEO|nr:histidinol-phosphate transaminase [Carboxydothermus ferrireducens]NYE56982.1 histidinol-phosphate aminotransferase [Carboxydothermus ferrireducens DSM 11255]
MNKQRYFKEAFAQLKPYEPHLVSYEIKLDANENPYPFPKSLLEEIFTKIGAKDFPLYPDPLAGRLRSKLSEKLGVLPENIVLGNGSDELILCLYLAFGGYGRVALSFAPSFVMYRHHAFVTQTEFFEVSYRDDFSLDLDETKKAIEKYQPHLVFLANPNNPTGTLVDIETIKKLLAYDHLLVIDEAYVEFSGVSAIDLLNKYQNLVILRTFSKARALAGLRLGYLVANNDVVKEIIKVKNPYNVNVFSQIAGEVVLANEEVFQEEIREIIAERERLYKELTSLGLKAVKSHANFILVEFGEKAKKIHQELINHGILVRYLGGALANYLRITVGTPEENRQFLKKLGEIL